MFKLRIATTPHIHDIHALPEVLSGSYDACNVEAARLGYVFKREKSLMFGGYFTHPETGDCLFITK